jgi:hypothetical protein
MCIIQLLFFCCSIEIYPLPIVGFSCTLSGDTIGQHPEDSETPCQADPDAQYYARNVKGMVIPSRMFDLFPLLYLAHDQ